MMRKPRIWAANSDFKNDMNHAARRGYCQAAHDIPDNQPRHAESFGEEAVHGRLTSTFNSRITASIIQSTAVMLLPPVLLPD